jgi:hypothetical protein
LGFAVIAHEAVEEVHRRTGWSAIAERHEDHLVPGRGLPIPAAVLPDEHALGEPAAHRRRREGNTERGDVRSEAVVRTDRGGYLLRILRMHAGVDVLAPVAVGPAIEAAVLHRGQIIRHKIRADLVALVGDGPELAVAGLDG